MWRRIRARWASFLTVFYPTVLGLLSLEDVATWVSEHQAGGWIFAVMTLAGTVHAFYLSHREAKHESDLRNLEKENSERKVASLTTEALTKKLVEGIVSVDFTRQGEDLDQEVRKFQTFQEMAKGLAKDKLPEEKS